MNSIRKNLVLDHLYFGVNEQEFEEIKQIFLRFDCASHEVVNADIDSWEGVYVMTRGQNYLEILKGHRIQSLGLCQKAFTPIAQDARNIINDFPTLPWKTIERTTGGKKWFTALSCDDDLNEKSPFYTWVMHYHQRDNSKPKLLKKFEISELFKIEFSANPCLREHIKLNTEWLNSENQFGESEFQFKIQTYYSDEFDLKISFDNEREGIEFKRAELKLAKNFEAENLRLKYFNFYFLDGRYILEKIQSQV